MNFRESFLSMSSKDDEALLRYKGYYKLHRKKSVMMTVMMQALNFNLAHTDK
jgi:hypothetical protein